MDDFFTLNIEGLLKALIYDLKKQKNQKKKTAVKTLRGKENKWHVKCRMKSLNYTIIWIIKNNISSEAILS